ncbi:unnamed protein product [Pleuronectes platessa]|uniref:Uncharacterized protein n=1 Tax=Pleuronectes platessa TaxID=8262 RepID=A0A9N7UUM2_PLEPL|nr:unnamed protein product [Pleuronectes platessa]
MRLWFLSVKHPNHDKRKPLHWKPVRHSPDVTELGCNEPSSETERVPEGDKRRDGDRLPPSLQLLFLSDGDVGGKEAGAKEVLLMWSSRSVEDAREDPAAVNPESGLSGSSALLPAHAPTASLALPLSL